MILWELESTEAVQIDMHLFYNHSLITKDQYIDYKLHSLHLAYLRHQNWTGIQKVI